MQMKPFSRTSAAVLSAQPPPAGDGTASTYAGNGNRLRSWLREQAGLADRIVDRVLRTLEDEEVFHVRDLRVSMRH